MQLKGKCKISNKDKINRSLILGDQKREEEGRGRRREEKKKSHKGMEFHGLVGKC